MSTFRTLPRAIIRSTLFNLAFYGVSALCCLALLPALFLPRAFLMGVVHFYLSIVTVLEYSILGLRYEIRGREHLPEKGSFILAAKHQSAYETLKLHFLLKDPAIVLKKELLSIPLWGQYLKKTDVIAIDRSSTETASQSVKEGGKRVSKQERPIVIFPQGTRVRPDETPADKRYKTGVARLQEATGLPIIPMALNSGMFWPRNSWLKSSGTVVFEFLPPIKPQKNRKAVMSKLEKVTEEATISLMNEAREKAAEKSSALKPAIAVIIAVALLIAAAGYSYSWFDTADRIRGLHANALAGDPGINYRPGTLVIKGFPGPLKVQIDSMAAETNEGSLNVERLQARLWPLPYMPVEITTGPITIRNMDWPNAVIFEGFQAEGSATATGFVDISDSIIKKDNFTASLAGRVNPRMQPYPDIDLVASLVNHQEFLIDLAQNGVIETRMALFLSAGFTALAGDDGVVRVPITRRENRIFAGPLPLASLPPASLPDPAPQPSDNPPAPVQ